MTIAQCKAARHKNVHRYGGGKRHGWSLEASIEREHMRALREQARKSKKK